jgi:hypothetical protein
MSRNYPFSHLVRLDRGSLLETEKRINHPDPEDKISGYN